MLGNVLSNEASFCLGGRHPSARPEDILSLRLLFLEILETDPHRCRCIDCMPVHLVAMGPRDIVIILGVDNVDMVAGIGRR